MLPFVLYSGSVQNYDNSKGDAGSAAYSLRDFIFSMPCISGKPNGEQREVLFPHLKLWYRGRAAVVYSICDGRGRITIDPRIPTLPGQSTSALYQKTLLAPCTKRREVYVEMHDG